VSHNMHKAYHFGSSRMLSGRGNFMWVLRTCAGGMIFVTDGTDVISA
jgi:hypothetical protein